MFCRPSLAVTVVVAADAVAAVVVVAATEVAVGAADMEEVAVDTEAVAVDTEVVAGVGDMEAADTVGPQASQALQNPPLGLAKRS